MNVVELIDRTHAFNGLTSLRAQRLPWNNESIEELHDILRFCSSPEQTFVGRLIDAQSGEIVEAVFAETAEALDRALNGAGDRLIEMTKRLGKIPYNDPKIVPAIILMASYNPSFMNCLISLMVEPSREELARSVEALTKYEGGKYISTLFGLEVIKLEGGE